MLPIVTLRSQPRLLGRSELHVALGDRAEGSLQLTITPDDISEVILIVFPCDAIRSRDTLASNATLQNKFSLRQIHTDVIIL